MSRVVPWAALVEIVAPHYQSAGVGRLLTEITLLLRLRIARTRIAAVLAAQPDVKQLFDHGWLHLVALEGATAYRYRDHRWTPFAAD
jgi:hypothetical protein